MAILVCLLACVACVTSLVSQYLNQGSMTVLSVFVGGRKVLQSVVEVSWPDLWLYDGLVHELAQRGAGCCLNAFHVQV